MSIGKIVQDDIGNSYKLVEKIKSSGFSTVYMACREIDNATFAVKMFSNTIKPEIARLSIEKEKNQMMKVDSPYVIKYLYVYDGQSTQGDLPFIIMEYAPNGTLNDFLAERVKLGKQLDNEELIIIFTQLATGMRDLNKKMVHRDIKPENLLIVGDSIRITDFGISKIIDENTRTSTMKGYGTGRYAAPEVWEGRPNTMFMDIYSMGIVFFELATLNYPYKVNLVNREKNYEEAHRFASLIKPSILNSALSPRLESVILHMLEKAPHKRFSSWEDILSILKKETSSLNSVSFYADKMREIQNEANLKLLNEEKEKEKLEKERNDRIRLIRCQFDEAIITPLKDLIKEFNNSCPSKDTISFLENRKNYRENYFINTIILPTRSEIHIQLEVLVKEECVRNVSVSNPFGPNYNRAENYVPQCKGRDILAWGSVTNSKGIGFNILLLKSEDSSYGDWYILKNKSSAFSRTPRLSPFAFDFKELPVEIEKINSVHIYSSTVDNLSSDAIFNFVVSSMANRGL